MVRLAVPPSSLSVLSASSQSESPSSPASSAQYSQSAQAQEQALHPHIDEQELRYARHLMLPGWDEATQAKLGTSHVLVIGAGGLASTALAFLASSGVGHITVVDDDVVSLSNLQRQIIHGQDKMGQPKVQSAKVRLQHINPHVAVQAVQARADAANLPQWVVQADVVLDCTDNRTSRYAVNAACVAAGKPLVTAAAVGYAGQLMVVQPKQACWACVYPPDQPFEDIACAVLGVFAPLVGMVGCMQAALALQCLTGLNGHKAPHPVSGGKLALIDGAIAQTDWIQVPRRANCSVCGDIHA